MTMFFIAIVISPNATSASVVDLCRLEEMRFCDNSSGGRQRPAFERDWRNHVALPAKSQQQRLPSVLHALCGFDRQTVASKRASIPPCHALTLRMPACIRAPAALLASGLCDDIGPRKRGRREGRVSADTHGPRATKKHAAEPQDQPNNRPSLRGWFTAYT
jgi:hypothetical protein